MKIKSIKKRYFDQPFVVVGCIIENKGKFLLVQEATIERGKWNQPAGWLDLGEKILDGAKREAQEETGLKIKITGFLGVYSLVTKHNNNYKHAVKLILCAKPLSNKISFNKQELMAVRWFSVAEIKKLGKKLRDPDIIQEIKDYQQGSIYPVTLANNFLTK